MIEQQRFTVKIQYILGCLTGPLLAPLYILGLMMMGYRIGNLSQARNACRKHYREYPGPWIICANHLTMIDSLLLTYVMFSLGGHLRHYRKLPWNLPERDNFQVNPILRVLCYLAKCIPVNRGGDREEMKKVMEKCGYLLQTGQCLMIFPEGGRSRTGRVDTTNYAYGVGRLIVEHPRARVMCMYLRGGHQDSYSALPRWGERFYVKVEPLTVARENLSGLRQQRALAAQVIQKLANMEEEYFVALRQ